MLFVVVGPTALTRTLWATGYQTELRNESGAAFACSYMCWCAANTRGLPHKKRKYFVAHRTLILLVVDACKGTLNVWTPNGLAWGGFYAIRTLLHILAHFSHIAIIFLNDQGGTAAAKYFEWVTSSGANLLVKWKYAFARFLRSADCIIPLRMALFPFPLVKRDLQQVVWHFAGDLHNGTPHFPGGGGGGGRARSLYATPPSPPPPRVLKDSGAVSHA